MQVSLLCFTHTVFLISSGSGSVYSICIDIQTRGERHRPNELSRAKYLISLGSVKDFNLRYRMFRSERAYSTLVLLFLVSHQRIRKGGLATIHGFTRIFPLHIF